MSERPASRRIRVIHILDSLNTGGTELNAVRTVERLDRDRYDVRVVCLHAHGPLRPRLDAAGIPVIEMAVPSLLSMTGIRRGSQLWSLIRQESIDIVHAHDPYANILAAPVVRFAPRCAMIASHRWWREVHRPKIRIANRLAYRFADRVLANSHSVGELVVREERVPRSRLVVIPNFVDSEAFIPLSTTQRATLRRQVGLGDDDLSIGIVANLHPVKNHRLLLRAAARLAGDWPAVRFVLVGDGPERSSLAQLADSLGIADRVLMPGRIAHVSGLHGIFDISVLTSDEEGFPNSVVEAMAAGRAVVATNVGGVPDAVEAAVTGLLVAAGDDAAFAKSLDVLLRDPDRRMELGAAGAARARALFHVDGVLGALEQLYLDLAGRT